MAVVRIALAKGQELAMAPSLLSPSKLLTAFPCWCVWGRGWVVIHCHVGNLPDLQTSFPVALIAVFHVGLRNTQGQGFP